MFNLREKAASRRRRLSVPAILLAGTAAGGSPVYAQEAEMPERASQVIGIEEIVVTAQKRAQSLQDVPISITALDASSIEANRVVTVRDLSAIAPNLTVRPAPGGTGGPVYSMRGILSLATAPGADKGVSLYVDGVYISSSAGSMFELPDIERIEVLKGPQGTLFGRNSTGGAINIITKEPQGEFGLKQDLTFGNYDQFRSRTRIDTPEFGPFSASISYTHAERRGDIKNLGAGTVWDFTNATGGKWGKRTSPKYLGDQNAETVSAAVKFDPSSRFNMLYRFEWSENDYTPDGVGVLLLRPSAIGPSGALISGTIATQPDKSILTQVSTKRPKAVNNAYTTRSHMSNIGHAVTANFQLTDNVSIKDVLAYRKIKAESTVQLDGMGGLVNTVAQALGPIGAPLSFVVSNVGHESKQWSNELQVTIDTDWFIMTAGYLHFNEKIATGGPAGPMNVTQFSTFPNYTIRDAGVELSRIKVISDAIYVQNEIKLSERAELVLGARLTMDQKSGTDNSVPMVTREFDYEHEQSTWLAGLNYRVGDDAMLFAKYSTGYISGGYLATRDYKPETVKSWEGGIKADFLDRRLRTNLAVYHADYTDLQVSVLGTAVGVPGAAQVIINGGSARAYGFEFEGTAIPAPGITLQANLGYTDFKYKDVNPAVGNKETYLPHLRPKWTANVSAQYDLPDFIGSSSLTLRADANYRSRSFTTYFVPDKEVADATSISDTWIVNARAALSDVRIAGADAQIAVWVRNLTNDRSAAFTTGLNFAYAANFERARTFGVDLGFRF